MPANLILASGSVFRRKMLLDAGVPCDAVRPDLDERALEAPLLEAGAAPEDVALALAEAKAVAVSEAHPARLVLGCDQTLVLGGEVFHKPPDMEAARRQLRKLSGQTHHLHSAAVLARNGEVLWRHAARSVMTMRHLSPAFIGRYCAAAGEQILSSVGAYQIEGLGVQLFERIEGDFFAIVGLPLLPVLSALREHGVLDE